MHRWLSSAGVSLLMLLSGCVPGIGGYYHAVASEGHPIGNMCNGTAGPPESLEIKRDLVRVVVTPINRGVGQDFIVIQLWIANKARVEFDYSQFSAINSLNQSAIVLDKPAVYEFDKGGFLPFNDGQVLDGSLHVDPISNTSLYRIELKLHDSIPTAFNFILPDMKINDILYPHLTIQYRNHVGVWLSLINC